MEVPLDDSGAVALVEVDEEEPGYVRAAASSPTELMEKVGGTVQAALERVIRPTVQVVVNQLREMRPDEVEIEFGLRLNAKAGAVFASTELDGHLKVRACWKHTPASTPTPAAAPVAEPRQALP